MYGNFKLDPAVGYHTSVLSMETPKQLHNLEGFPHVCPALSGSGETKTEVAHKVFRRSSGSDSGEVGPKNLFCPAE